MSNTLPDAGTMRLTPTVVKVIMWPNAMHTATITLLVFFTTLVLIMMYELGRPWGA